MARAAKRKLTDIKPTEVSLVDTPANGEKFFIVKRETRMPEAKVEKGYWESGEWKITPEDVAASIASESAWLIQMAGWNELKPEDLIAKISATVNFLFTLVDTQPGELEVESIQKSTTSDFESVFKSCHEKLTKLASEVLASSVMPKDGIIEVAKSLRGLTGTKEKTSSSPVEKKDKSEEDVMKEMIVQIVEVMKGLQTSVETLGKTVSEIRADVKKNEETPESPAPVVPAVDEVKPVEPTPVVEEKPAPVETVQKNNETVAILKDIQKKLDDQASRIALIEKVRETPAGSEVNDTKKASVQKNDDASFGPLLGLKA